MIRRLGRMGKVFLKIRVSRTRKENIRKLSLQSRSRPNLPRDTCQRILWRLIPVRGGKQSRSLDMGVVVRASSRDTDEVDVQALQQTQEFLTLFQRYGNGILAIATEPVPVFSVDGFRRPEPILILSKRHEIKCAHANGQIEPGDFRTRPLHNFSQESGAIFEGAAVVSRAIDRRQKFVPQVAMTMLDVHEAVAAIPGEAGRVYEQVDDAPDF